MVHTGCDSCVQVGYLSDDDFRLAEPVLAGVLAGVSSVFWGRVLIPEYRDWHDFWSIVASNPDMTRGMAQLSFTAPFYAGIGYSLAAWIFPPHKTGPKGHRKSEGLGGAEIRRSAIIT